jgi:hypothetical protein
MWRLAPLMVPWARSVMSFIGDLAFSSMDWVRSPGPSGVLSTGRAASV